MKKFFKEFKEFALKGKVIDLAVGVIIGAAFQGIVTSLTSNIISPIIGLFTRQNFDQMELSLFGTTIKYGAFITSVINFFIMALVVFVIVRSINKLFLTDEPKGEVSELKECPYCLSSIPAKATRCPACTSQLE